MTRPDPYLWFAMRPGFPAFLTDGVAELLEGRALEAVPTGETSAIVEVLGHAQPLRAGVAAVPPLVLAGLLDRTGIAGSWAEVMWTLTLTAVMVVPAYMMVLGVVQVRLRRSSQPEQVMSVAHPGVLTALKVAPLLAAGLAFAIGLALH